MELTVELIMHPKGFNYTVHMVSIGLQRQKKCSYM